MINAVILLRAENYGAGASRCLDYCAARRYNVVVLIPGDQKAAVRMLDEGTATVIVVSSTDQLDPENDPRVEVVPKRLGARQRRNAANPRRYTAGTPTRSGALRRY